jgi:hypothetical protein
VFHCGTVATRVLAGATMRRLCRARISTREAVIIWPAHRTPARPRHSPANPGNAWQAVGSGRMLRRFFRSKSTQVC